MRPVQLTYFVSHLVPHSRLDGLCLGTPIFHQHQRQSRTVYHFRPGQIFGVVWWRRYADDRQHRTLAIVQALGSDPAGHKMPDIHKAVAVLAIVDQYGPAGQDGAVDQLLDLIEDLKHRGRKPEELPPMFWTEAVHKILLHPSLADSPTAEGIRCPIA